MDKPKLTVGDTVVLIKTKYKDLNGVILQVDKANKAIVQFINNKTTWREVLPLEELKLIDAH